MSDNIIQLNQELIHNGLKDLVHTKIAKFNSTVPMRWNYLSLAQVEFNHLLFSPQISTLNAIRWFTLRLRPSFSPLKLASHERPSTSLANPQEL